METLRYQIQFFSYWHCGSGLIGGTESDAKVIRDEHEFPIVPGKTLKGLLRDAAKSLLDLNSSIFHKEFMNRVFGEEVDITQNRETYDAQSCFFSDAELTYALKEKVLKQENRQKAPKHLFELLSSTAIDKYGQAKDQSLRTLEVTIPMVLSARIEGIDVGKGDKEALLTCMKWIKRMGYNRNRGLGRCQFLST